ncbi:MAG: hypothetical protein ABIH03_05690 [Pseudomonadota bacterium]
MDLLLFLLDLLVHLDKHLASLLLEHGAWVYLLLFLIVFCETGLVVTPFLPGDSLLFVAGVGSMTHARFQLFNFTGGALWVASLLYAGFFFGNIPFIRNNLTLVIFGIIGISLVPVALEYLRHRLRRA